MPEKSSGRGSLVGLGIRQTQRRPSVVYQVLKTMGGDVQCGGVERVLILRCRFGPLRAEHLVDFIFDGRQFRFRLSAPDRSAQRVK